MCCVHLFDFLCSRNRGRGQGEVLLPEQVICPKLGDDKGRASVQVSGLCGGVFGDPLPTPLHLPPGRALCDLTGQEAEVLNYLSSLNNFLNQHCSPQ